MKTWVRTFWPEKTTNIEALGWERGPARKPGVLEHVEQQGEGGAEAGDSSWAL